MEDRKTALVLGGGGARGAYEIGVWQAVRELGISIDIVTGSSVGAINGALVAQDAFDLAVSLWKEADTAMVFDVEIKDILTNSGLGNGKLKSLLHQYIDEAAIRKSSIEYGLVTAELPVMAPKYIMKDQIPEGMLLDYILASSALFPAMKSYEINSSKYVDGGFTDNLPVGLALDHGATHVIAVDLDVVAVIRKKRINDADFLRIIQCPWDLGNILIFDKNNSRKIMRLGYLDTLKAFQVYDGSFYCFAKGEFDKRNIQGANTAGLIFELDPEIIYKKFIYNIHLNNAVDLHVKSTEKELQSDSGTLVGRILDSILKAKTTLNQKTLTLIIAKSLKESDDTKNIFLTKPAMKLLRDEILAANYLIKEGLV
ncbi:MAG TPA: patatin-like phospholipase family protein [Anaerovoracaceae bacterium]|nr:patatin-like phospholipase family protein [Anaerovoracaceae bacterium]